MSFTNILKPVVVVAIGLFTGYQLTKNLSSGESQPYRSLASTSFSKMGQEQMADQFLELKSDLSLLSLKNSDISEISVTLTALKNINEGLNYTWSLPPQVSLVAGTISGQTSSLKAGETLEFRIKLSGFSKETRRYISFKVNGPSTSVQLKKEMLLSSRMEDAIEYKLHQAEIKKDNQINTLNKRKNKFSAENVIK